MEQRWLRENFKSFDPPLLVMCREVFYVNEARVCGEGERVGRFDHKGLYI